VDDHITSLSDYIIADLSVFGELDVADGRCGAELRKIQFRLQVALARQSDDGNANSTDYRSGSEKEKDRDLPSSRTAGTGRRSPSS
jgi:hypothetical protein